MLAFLRPVKGLVFLACFWLAVWVVIEIFTIRQAGEVTNHLKNLAVDRPTIVWTSIRGTVVPVMAGLTR